MSTARFLLALACTCTSAAIALAGESAVELELELAKEPALYLKLNVRTDALQVMARGHELDRIQAESVRLLVHHAPGEDRTPSDLALPALWRVASAPEVQWRRVVAPPTLVPYKEDAEPPTPVPDATPPAEIPAQYEIQLDNGWSLHLGPEPPGDFWPRLRERLDTGWKRLTGRSVEVAAPAVVVMTSADDARRLLHIFREGTPILVVCDDEAVPPPAAGSAASAASPASGAGR
jgi:hypothetical protein